MQIISMAIFYSHFPNKTLKYCATDSTHVLLRKHDSSNKYPELFETIKIICMFV